jgi:hypothetical protein
MARRYFTLDPDGLTIDRFVSVIFKQLRKQIPRLANPREAAHTVAILEELFEQIDINGDTRVDWNEFTSFNIENGMSATNQSTHSRLDEYSISMQPDRSHPPQQVQPLHPLVKMVYVPETKRVYAIQKDFDTINAYTNKGQLAHSLQIGDKVR